MSGAPVGRFAWERLFLTHSGLPSPARLIGLVLATKADPDMTIPARFSPSLSTLVALTGLGRGTVADHLNGLEAAGWVRRIRPTTAASFAGHQRTRYVLVVPAGVPVEEGQNTPSESWTSPGAGRGAVREPDGTSPGAGHKPALPITSSNTSAADASALHHGAEPPAVPGAEDVLDSLAAEFGPLAPAEEGPVRSMVERGKPRPMVANWIAGRRDIGRVPDEVGSWAEWGSA